MIVLKEKEKQVLKIIKTWQKEYRNSPNTSDLARALKIRHQNAYYVILRLEEKGYLELIRLGKRLLIKPLAYE